MARRPFLLYTLCMEPVKESKLLSKGINFSAPINVLYYVLFILFFNYHFMRTTMFSKERLYIYNDIFELWYNRLTTVLLVLTVFTIIFLIPKISYKAMAVLMLVIVALYDRNREVITYRQYLVFVMLIISSYGKSYKKIGITALISGWAWILVSAVASQTGYISDIVYRSGRSHSFGSIYSTDLFCHVLTLTMVYYIIRKGKLTIWEYMGTLLILVVNVFFIGAKIGLACMFLLMVGTLFYQHVLPKQKIPQRFTRDVFAVSTLSFFIFAALMYILTLTYTSSPKLPVNSIHALRTIKLRFIYGQQALRDYTIEPWGTAIREVGNGGVQEGTVSQEDYFFIDISYIKLMLREGYFIFTMVMLVFFVAEIRLFRQKNYYAMFILFVFAFDCAVEHHIFEIGYSLLIYLSFCDLEAKPLKIDVKSWLPLHLMRTRRSSREIPAAQISEKSCP